MLDRYPSCKSSWLTLNVLLVLVKIIGHLTGRTLLPIPHPIMNHPWPIDQLQATEFLTLSVSPDSSCRQVFEAWLAQLEVWGNPIPASEVEHQILAHVKMFSIPALRSSCIEIGMDWDRSEFFATQRKGYLVPWVIDNFVDRKKNIWRQLNHRKGLFGWDRIGIEQLMTQVSLCYVYSRISILYLLVEDKTLWKWFITLWIHTKSL